VIGHQTEEEVNRYTRAASQNQLATSASETLEKEQNKNKIV